MSKKKQTKRNKRNKQKNRTKVSAKSITDSLMKSLKEKEADEIARHTGFLKRKRDLIPIDWFLLVSQRSV